jgi:hypothetical protein
MHFQMFTPVTPMRFVQPGLPPLRRVLLPSKLRPPHETSFPVKAKAYLREIKRAKAAALAPTQKP